MATETTPTEKTVGDLTVAELVALLRKTVAESLTEIVGYPDEQPEPGPGAEAETAQGTGADGTGVSAQMARKAGGLSVEDFRFWVHQIVGEVGEDLIGDPDEGLEFTEEFAAGLDKAIAEVEAGMTIPGEEVHRRLGLD